MEIEKKYRVKELPEGYKGYPCKAIEQAYLCRNPVVRARKSNEEYSLTYKSPLGAEGGQKAVARVSNEIEAPLTKEGYCHLREKADGYLIEKKRYVIPLGDGLLAELDIFEGRLSGLAIVEVEFPDEEAASRFAPPAWFGEDVTFDRRYVNKNMIDAEDLPSLEAQAAAKPSAQIGG